MLVGVFVAGLVAIARDSLTKSLRAAQHERQLAEQRATLIQTVSHEFRTPLTILSGTIQTLHGRPEVVDDRFRPLLESAVRAERRLSEMVAVVLAAADATDEALRQRQERVSVSEMLDDIVASLPRGGHRVLRDIGPGAERLVTSPAHLRLAVRELIANGLRFTSSDQPVEVRVRRANGDISICVRDHGDGIEPADHRRALQPFTQLDPSITRRVGGLGMGLFTARRLAEGFGGSLTLSRAPGGGLDAILTLPQLRQADREGDPRHDIQSGRIEDRQPTR